MSSTTMVSTALRSCRTLPGQWKLEEPAPHVRREPFDVLAMVLGELPAKMLHQRHDVLATVRQRRQTPRVTTLSR